MENSHGAEIPPKTKSLDIKSLYKPNHTVPRDGPCCNLKRKRKVDESSDDKRSDKKKSRKAVSIDGFNNVRSSKGSKSLEEVYNGSGLSPSLHDPNVHSKLGYRAISLALEDGSVNVPRRKRGFVGRRKVEIGDQVSKPEVHSSDKESDSDQIGKLVYEDTSKAVDAFKVKPKKGVIKLEQNLELKADRHSGEEDTVAGPSVVKTGNSSTKESHDDNLLDNSGGSSLKTSFRKRSRKRKDPLTDRCLQKEEESSVGAPIKVSDDLRDDDEENLEENAARMLSSRFDPSCTAFSSNSKLSSLPFLLSSRQRFFSQGSNSVSGSESTSVDAAARVLRPRKLHDEKGNSRKRRHYYEVFSGDLDAYWVLNRRIKVFWPLDQIWYYGRIDDYNEEVKLHHVKYDDRDEEWIDLGSERFKLLLLPSEVPAKSRRKRSVTRDKCFGRENGKVKLSQETKKNISMQVDSYEGNYMDSEPIISWLAQSTRRVKCSPCHDSKKQKTSSVSSAFVPQLSKKPVLSKPHDLGNRFMSSNESKLSVFSSLPNNLTTRAEVPSEDGPSCSKDNKPPVVYYRRRFRRSSNSISHTLEQNLISTSLPESESFPTSLDSGVREETDSSLARLGPNDSLERLDAFQGLLSTYNERLSRLDSSTVESRRFMFELSFPTHSLLSYSFDAASIWFLHAVLLHQYGVLMTTWPMVQLEMLVVDNMVGLRFLLFEGCLKDAVALVFLLLAAFHQPNVQGKYSDFQMPVTSIRFKFSCIEDSKKQLVFSFYNFFDVDDSKWLYLDYKLKRHCVAVGHLPLPDCTQDNIKALQNGTNWQLNPSVFRNCTSSKDPMSRSGHINSMGVSSKSLYVDARSPSSRSDKYQKCFPPFVLSFTAAPTFFLGLHLKLLLEHGVSCVAFRNQNLMQHPETSGCLIANDFTAKEDCSGKGLKNRDDCNCKESSDNTDCDRAFSFAKPVQQNSDVSTCSIGGVAPSSNDRNSEVYFPTSASSEDPVKVASSGPMVLQKQESDHSESEQCDLLLKEKSDNGSQSLLNDMTVEIPSFNVFEKHSEKESNGAQPSSDLSWNMNGGIIPSPNPTARRSTWNRSRNSSASFGYLVHRWSDAKADLLQNNFGVQPKKPRTQVSYALPFGRVDYGSRNKSNQQKGNLDKRTRSVNEKRYSNISTASEGNTEAMFCDANILITHGDRGWRERGVEVVLEVFDQNEWKLGVKISGIMKYSYKAHQFLQPGSTNRYTHAMMWKGGKDWTLEFPDRSQWALFKVMHEECYNRNIRAASVKNIPIPGVHLIEENDDHVMELPFVRSSSKYIRQVETDVEMALNPSRVMYDMDSDDEEWLKNQSCSAVESSRSWGISEEMLERTIDMFEKASYAQQCVNFTSAEIEELMAGLGPMEAIKAIHEYWQHKRQKKGMPLIRHLQPPLWERYQQQLQEWEQAMGKSNTGLLSGFHERLSHVEKPPMFAFCFKPRGLEVPNKGSKQRSQRKFSVSGQVNALNGDHDGFHHAYGRRSNGYSNGDEKIGYSGYNCEPLDDSPLRQMSPRVFSPRRAGGIGHFSMNGHRYDRNHLQKLHRSKSKRPRMSVSPNGIQMGASYSQRMSELRKGDYRWNMGFHNRPSQRQHHLDSSMRHGPEWLDDSDLDELRFLDASGLAKHARIVAKCKREDAQRLLCRADVAIHRAVVALMTAEAMRASSEDLNGDG